MKLFTVSAINRESEELIHKSRSSQLCSSALRKLIMFTCAECNASFTRKDNLQRHAKLHQIPLFGCEECVKKFYRKDKLKRHQSTHSTRKVSHGRPVCTYCSRTFCNPHYTKKHEKTCPKNDKVSEIMHLV